WPGVLLLHMLNSNRSVWEAFAAQLTDAGYVALAVDMRGHGETGGEREWEKARDDLARAWRYLADQSDVDPGRTAVVGASIGANLALITAADEPAVRTAV
ncbi:MAG: alpha/beta fold hydrolase, partial [Planctomycetales bacterium]|nr:alpha/beta fold hydrolase [Planctomycetales bacterium]NIM09716.1 alpha/beta fold hydrolase [Planctomycetales bacterium]NIN09193.1 alpha/beta fold hydrolase [Planctomycetales bacterium]NIN78291.1 alpha/beta fold hydrolase [Planctomycetales bacterium]NIP05371.1 alpha/beta fold hydrolase [Planctomycetales bacterium]